MRGAKLDFSHGAKQVAHITQSDQILALSSRQKSFKHLSCSQEAGGVVTDMKGAKLDFSHGAKLVKNKGVVASASTDLHEKVKPMLKWEADLDK